VGAATTAQLVWILAARLTEPEVRAQADDEPSAIGSLWTNWRDRVRNWRWHRDVWGLPMRLLRLLLPVTLLAGCANTTSAGPAQISCQPYGYSPVPIALTFAPGPATAASAEQTAVALIRSCAATPDSSWITITITDLASNVKGGTGERSGPNAGQPVWLVQIDTTEAVKGGTYPAHYWVEVNQATGVPTLVAYG